jgi:adenine-specific DNA methylase
MAAAALALQKRNGVYYTDRAVGRFLASWALPTVGGSVLDPSCGAGVFLREALDQRAPSYLGGVGIAADAVAATEQLLRNASATALQRDFFAVTPEDLQHFDAVVGNPPFIRYHRFTGEARLRALSAARRAGVRLTALCSAWAPFLVHACQFVKPGGRLAMVAPAELLHAAYAVPVLRYLCSASARVVILAFERRLFPDLSEDTVLVLAADRAAPFRELRLINLGDISQLDTLLAVDPLLRAGRPLPAQAIIKGEERALPYLLPDATRRLYAHLRSSTGVARLGDWTSVGIGYVTGNNDYFHLPARDVALLGIPRRYLRRAVRRADDLRGAAYTADDWLAAEHSGARCYVLSLPADGKRLPEPLQSYIAAGEARGVHRAHKCATRQPWYAVPGLAVPDAFLSYMVHLTPLFAVNRAQAVAPNSLLVARRKPGSPPSELIAVAMRTSLALLSAEIEGHSLGGGLLKVEPGEAAKITIPVPARFDSAVFDEVDALLRAERRSDARNLADAVLLQHGLGLSERDCRKLREGAGMLRQRRLSR